ncbi:protein of unknown function [Acidithiobacillus ferrivorans]|uniref:Uncharacterized protein n=1 Tax=Acidithiobacillus ferrivorans TaxID=160808 RepID=A0ABY1MNV4_9PROT|nr:protein of unknown function [Acidithiobacillus ferrivorans]
MPGTMHGQYRLLLAVLGRHEAHVGSSHRFADCLGVRRVVLVRLDVRLDELRCHQLGRVAQGFQLSGPVMRAATSFHPDQAGSQVGEKRNHLLALELLLHQRLAAFVDTMHLQNVFCQINPNCRNLHFGRLSSWVEMSHLHLGTQMPLGKGATIPLVGLSRASLFMYNYL